MLYFSLVIDGSLLFVRINNYREGSPHLVIGRSEMEGVAIQLASISNP